MELEVTPPVEGALEQALRAALANPEAGGRPPEPAWRRAALAEGVEREDGYELSPRSTRGATRA